ncbi:MAG: hypothetical protein JW798_00850 [Prolixibacteraceae bacterium]|nr:hypothetical protein [Prolixibacteraceae bacterium]
MGRKEFYERLEELNRIRKRIIEKLNSIDTTPREFKLLEKIEKEISHLKLLH